MAISKITTRLLNEKVNTKLTNTNRKQKSINDKIDFFSSHDKPKSWDGEVGVGGEDMGEAILC